MTQTPSGNLLASETSPYLLQHADNPVHWQPWGEAALTEAARQDKPILLSIGYSACHWCHVMAHESFEDVATARLMNDGFVNIKVDREERPDLDQIYQLAQQMLTQQPGGWPLTMFLTPDAQIPFFGGTYFPDAPRHGMPSFKDVLTRVLEYFRGHREDIANQSDAILEVFRRSDPAPADGITLNAEPIDAARRALLAEFDGANGGFGGAPKFPLPGHIETLLRHWRAGSGDAEPDLQALYMATRSLQAMAEGGLYDQIGGGFFRYCVDARWEIPHFEKMLYDNAALLSLYPQAYAATKEPLYWRVANETADWVLREMRAPEGGFYATLDADSEGGEGAFYAWDKDEFAAALPAGSDRVLDYFGLGQPANFEGKWHLKIAGAAPNGDDDAWHRALADARARLYAVREQRPRPFRDTKILTAWNGLMIRGFACAARHLERDDLAVAAQDAVDFIRAGLFVDGRLLAVHKDGRSRFNGYLDDYAFLLDGLLELLQTRFRSSDAVFAVELADVLLEHFFDRQDGGFFFTSDDHESLLHRMKRFDDNATPSGNGVAARALLRLGHLLGDSRYLDAAEATLRAAWDPLARVPHGHGTLLGALEETLTPTQVVVIRAPAADLPRWRSPASGYAPRRLLLAIPDDARNLPGLLAERVPREGGIAYVCSGQTCDAPVDSPAALLGVLGVR